MKKEVTRRDFLRVVFDAAKKLPVLPFVGRLGNPDAGENPITVDWIPTRNESVIEGFTLADRLSQRYQYLFTPDSDTYIYGLSISAMLAPSPLEPDRTLFITNKPVAELYTLSANPQNAGYVENSEGRTIGSSLDPRIVSDAIAKFYTTNVVEMFLYVVAAVPKADIGSETLPRDLRCEDVKPEVPRFITSAPFASPVYDSSQIPVGFHKSATGVDLLFPDAIRLTGKDGRVGFYIGKPRYTNQVS
jgi:hypothetical protein